MIIRRVSGALCSMYSHKGSDWVVGYRERAGGGAFKVVVVSVVVAIHSVAPNRPTCIFLLLITFSCCLLWVWTRLHMCKGSVLTTYCSLRIASVYYLDIIYCLLWILSSCARDP